MRRGQQRRHREPSLLQLMLTHGHKGLEAGSEPAHARRRPKAPLVSFTLQSQAWEGDQLERAGQGGGKMSGFWSQKN